MHIMVDPRQSPNFYNYINTNPNPHIHLLQLGWEKCKPNYTYTEYREMYLIHFIESGLGTVTIDKKVYPQQKGSIILTRPKQTIIFSADKKTPWKYFWFAFCGTFAAELIERTFFKNGVFEFRLENDHLRDMIVDSAIKLENSEEQDIYGLIVLFKLLNYLIEITRQKVLPVTSKEKNNISHIYKAQEYIHLNYNKPIHTCDIAKTLNIDRTYFYRIFKTHTGLSPEEYLIDFRIQKAIQLLKETQLPITTIAQSVGYSYTSFYSIFCKKMNTTPSCYRLLLKESKT